MFHAVTLYSKNKNGMFFETRCLYTVRHKNKNYINCNLKMDDQILIIFGTNILDTNGHQKTIYVPALPKVCFCTTWRKQNTQNITFLFNAVSLCGSHNVHSAYFVQIFITLADSLSNCLVVQLLTGNIGHLCKPRLADAFSIHWGQCRQRSAPDFNQSFFEFIDIPKQCPTNSLLQNTANIVEWTVIRSVRGYMSGVIKFTDVFLLFNSCGICFVSPGNAETNVGWAGNLNVHLIASCVRNFHTNNY